jgi:hypothetical protein
MNTTNTLMSHSCQLLSKGTVNNVNNERNWRVNSQQSGFEIVSGGGIEIVGWKIV